MLCQNYYEYFWTLATFSKLSIYTTHLIYFRAWPNLLQNCFCLPESLFKFSLSARWNLRGALRDWRLQLFVPTKLHRQKLRARTVSYFSLYARFSTIRHFGVAQGTGATKFWTLKQGSKSRQTPLSSVLLVSVHSSERKNVLRSFMGSFMCIPSPGCGLR